MVSKKQQREMMGTIFLKKDRMEHLTLSNKYGYIYLQDSYDIKETIKNLGLTRVQKDDLEGGFKVEVTDVMEYGRQIKAQNNFYGEE